MRQQEEYVRRDSGDFRQGRDDDMGEEAERQERRGMTDPVWLPEDLEDRSVDPHPSPAPRGDAKAPSDGSGLGVRS